MDSTIIESTSRIVIVCDADFDDIIPPYLEDRKTECPAIRELVAKGAFEEIRTIAHGMKGSGGCYGFANISEIGRDMEAAAKRSDTGAILEQVVLLDKYLNRVEVRYE